jgi:hypothetical protein
VFCSHRLGSTKLWPAPRSKLPTAEFLYYDTLLQYKEPKWPRQMGYPRTWGQNLLDKPGARVVKESKPVLQKTKSLSWLGWVKWTEWLLKKNLLPKARQSEQENKVVLDYSPNYKKKKSRSPHWGGGREATKFLCRRIIKHLCSYSSLRDRCMFYSVTVDCVLCITSFQRTQFRKGNEALGSIPRTK